MKLWNNKLLQ